MIMKWLGMGALCAALIATAAHARVVRLEILRRQPVLSGKPFGGAGSYEKLVGKVHFALDPKLAINKSIVDLDLAPRNAQGEVEFTADFFMLKLVDPKMGNHRLFYEVGNRRGRCAWTCPSPPIMGRRSPGWSGPISCPTIARPPSRWPTAITSPTRSTT